MKEKNTRTKKMTQKIMIFLVVMICVGMISAVTTTAVTNDKTPTTTNQAESKSNVTKTTVNKKNTDLNNKETVNKNNTDSNNKTIKANSKKKKTPVAKFKTKKGKTYCKISGKKIKNQLVTVKNKTYLLDKKGVMVTGWANYKKDYYYFGRTNGKMAKKCTVDGIKLDKAGKAKQTDLSVAKIKTMTRARKQLNELCKYTDTKQQKLRKCFDWIAKRPYKRYRFLKKIYKQKGWESTFADDIFIHGDGCCVSESAALAFLLHEAGYKDVYVAHDSEHAWVELNGKVYDALFARAKDYNKYYNLSYKNYNCHPVDKRKI